MKVMRPVFSIVLNAETNAFAENISVKVNGVKMTSLDGDVVEIKDRTYHTSVEQLGGGKVGITIDIVNEGDKIEERIDYMLEEEYELEPLVEVAVKSNKTPISWVLDLRHCEQTQKFMDLDMNPGVRETMDFLTSSAIEFDDAFIGELVKEFNSGSYQHILDFINKLSIL